MSNTKQLLGIQSLLRFPDARVILVQGQANFEAATRLFLANPVLGWEGAIGEHVLPGNRHILFWPKNSLPQYVARFAGELPESAHDALGLSIFAPDNPADCVNPVDFEAKHLPKQWMQTRLKPLVLPARVATVAADAPELAQARAAELGVVEPGGSVRKRKPKPELVPDTSWRRDLIRSASGAAKPIVANVLTALRGSPEWQGVLAYNTFALQTHAIAATPFGSAGVWDDNMDVLAADWMQHAGVCAPPHVVAQGIEALAKESPYHPVRDYLDTLAWDGFDRIDTWLTRYCGVSDSVYTRAAGRVWLISACARARNPGCKADMALILEGPQGALKSTVFDVLGGDWFTDDMEKLGSKDASMQAMAAWIVELAELDAMNRKVEISAVKAFLSRRTDRVRLPYGKRIITAHRQCVFGGTVNPGGAGFLHDETGNRRFLPVTVGMIDIESLRADRGLLWAEADALYRAGQQWWFTDEAVIAAAKGEQDARREHDLWEVKIGEYLKSRPDSNVKIWDILEHLGLELRHQGKAEQRRAGACLRQLGWEPTVQRTGKDTLRGWKKPGSYVTEQSKDMFED